MYDLFWRMENSFSDFENRRGDRFSKVIEVTKIWRYFLKNNKITQIPNDNFIILNKNKRTAEIINWCKKTISPFGDKWIYRTFRKNNTVLLCFANYNDVILAKLVWG